MLQSDVEGSTSKPLTKTRNCRDNSLYIDDIEGTRHTIKDRMMRTNRHVDPLQPNYVLPSYTSSMYAEPKFIRDNIDVSDIQQKGENRMLTFKTRDIMKTSDLVGSQPGWKPRHR